MSDIWTIIGLVGAALMFAVPVAYAALKGSEILLRFKRHRAAFAIFAVGLCIYAGAKHGVPIVEKPEWMTASAQVDTNTWQKATFTISASGIIEVTAPLYIDVALNGQATTNWQNLVTTTWGDRPGEVSFASLSPSNPTNYLARIRCDASPTDVRITDFAVVASITSRFVTCTFTAPTNLVGKVGIAQVNEPINGNFDVTAWRTIRIFPVATNNTISVSGNYISRGIERRFRVIVNGVTYDLSEDAE